MWLWLQLGFHPQALQDTMICTSCSGCDAFVMLGQIWFQRHPTPPKPRSKRQETTCWVKKNGSKNWKPRNLISPTGPRKKMNNWGSVQVDTKAILGSAQSKAWGDEGVQVRMCSWRLLVWPGSPHNDVAHDGGFSPPQKISQNMALCQRFRFFFANAMSNPSMSV